jgi:hypothetical protein
MTNYQMPVARRRTAAAWQLAVGVIVTVVRGSDGLRASLELEGPEESGNEQSRSRTRSRKIIPPRIERIERIERTIHFTESVHIAMPHAGHSSRQ